MNIIVSPYEKEAYYFRSDSTLIRAIDDYYIPDFVSKVSVIPILTFRIDRAGKAIKERFAIRYFGPFTYGILLKCEIENCHATYRNFMENSMDFSTIIPKNMTDLEKYMNFLSEDGPLKIEINGIEKFKMIKNPDFSFIYRKLSLITEFCSIRTGDFFACELSAPVDVAKGDHIIESFDVEKRVDLMIR